MSQIQEINMDNLTISVCLRLLEERKRLNKVQSEVADICGVSIKTVGRWESSTPIPSDKLSSLKKLGFDVLYVLTGTRSIQAFPSPHKESRSLLASINSGHRITSKPIESIKLEIPSNTNLLPMGSDFNTSDLNFVKIPFYPLPKETKMSVNDVITSMLFKKEWILNTLHTDPDNLYLLHIEGDSMEPSLRAGDIILIDETHIEPKRDGIYVIKMGESLLVKRLQRLPNHRIKVTSDNNVYDAFEISLDTDLGKEFSVIGRVVWSGRHQ